MKRKTVEFSEKLKNGNTYQKQLVRELKSQNLKLQQKVAGLEAEKVTARNRIKALEKLKLPPERKPTSDIEIARRIAFILNRAKIRQNGKPLSKKKS